MQTAVQAPTLSIFLVSDQPEHVAQWRKELQDVEIHEAGQVPELLLGIKQHSVSWVVLDVELKLGCQLFAKTLRSVSQVPLVFLGTAEGQISQGTWVRNISELRSLLGLPKSGTASFFEPWQEEVLINEEALARTLGYKSDRIVQVIRQQLEELPAKVRAWNTNRNVAEIQREAHALKGAFGSIGCVRLWRGFEATDFDAKRGNLAEIHRRLPALEEAVTQTITAVQNKLGKG
jgi:hypothetical protein